MLNKKKELIKYEKLLSESEQQLKEINPKYDLLRHEEEQKTAQFVSQQKSQSQFRVKIVFF